MKVDFHLEKQKKPTSEQGVKVVYGQAKRGGYRLRWYLTLALVVSPLLVMGYYLFRNYVLVIALGVVTTEPVTITATNDGIVDTLRVEPGESIAESSVLLTMNNAVLASDIRFLEAELRKLDKRLTDSTEEELVVYQQAIDEAKTNLEVMASIRKRYDTYRSSGKVSDVDYAAIISVHSQAEQLVNTKTVDYQRALIDRQVSKAAGPVAQAQRQLMGNLVVKKAQYDSLTIVTPYGGNIVDVQVAVGSRVFIGDPLLTVSRHIEPKVVAYLNPRYLNSARQGSKASVKFPDGRRYSATVTEKVEMTSRLPAHLAKPFEGQPALLKVTLTFDQALEKNMWVESIPVEVIF
ncbi:HlyD family efflux transporter periplasmic adaptor subunit [Aestuariirhabdus sp. Z084]|uniref:HlyD family secretion protein n=1 Tax=Aestuariirhabdus haliotis TaxID=2918751 RepID=UPI00201B3EEB|nr:HlyD family secretion protein [Aestuariirhabdus haliotis]MCL6415993.1 HlyD family efflux transporter periplasmic adaptor subunit [Aestuariirhabdus haliotis]MCL6419974.1 HlyD family efflux transporter periplasmic adaptor subunit [Aestuariirhabdus haliotis]